MNSKSTAVAKYTKRQRKALRGDNAAKRSSLATGDVQLVGSTEYRGTPPVYHNINVNRPTLPAYFVKVTAGIPYAKVGA